MISSRALEVFNASVRAVLQSRECCGGVVRETALRLLRTDALARDRYPRFHPQHDPHRN